jgi:hypothetical protein
MNAVRSHDGFTAPADTHVIFTLPMGVRIPRITFFGGADYDQQRYWGYCFSGHEQANKDAGKTGKAMYDGQFFYSLGERKAQVARPNVADTDLLGIKDQLHSTAPEMPKSIAEIFDTTDGPKSCYVMSSVQLPAGLDDDGDDFNNTRERLAGTNPRYPDSDNDGIPDGSEVFITKTNPMSVDTDNDGLVERCEDKNANGKIEADETSATVADTDRDGLCDGNGLGIGCPEAHRNECTTGPQGRQCIAVAATPVHGEDMNQNCMVDAGETSPRNPNTFGIPDFDYKWNQFMTTSSYSSVNRTAPEFPIPDFKAGMTRSSSSVSSSSSSSSQTSSQSSTSSSSSSSN